MAVCPPTARAAAGASTAAVGVSPASAEPHGTTAVWSFPLFASKTPSRAHRQATEQQVQQRASSKTWLSRA